MSAKRQRSSGFTLFEVLVVVSIIIILASILLAALSAAKERARVVRARSEIAAITQAFQAYWMQYGDFPWAGEESLNAANIKPINGDNDLGIAFMELGENVVSNGFGDPWYLMEPSEETFYRVRLEQSVQDSDTRTFRTRVYFPNRFAYGDDR